MSRLYRQVDAKINAPPLRLAPSFLLALVIPAKAGSQTVGIKPAARNQPPHHHPKSLCAFAPLR